MKILHSAICLFKFYSLPLMTVLQMFFALCSMNKIFEKIKISDGFKISTLKFHSLLHCIDVLESRNFFLVTSYSCCSLLEKSSNFVTRKDKFMTLNICHLQRV